MPLIADSKTVLAYCRKCEHFGHASEERYRDLQHNTRFAVYCGKGDDNTYLQVGTVKSIPEMIKASESYKEYSYTPEYKINKDFQITPIHLTIDVPKGCVYLLELTMITQETRND